MIDLEALKAAGLTNARLKAIFTAKAPDGPQDGAKAKKPKRFKGEAPAQDVAASATGPTEPYQNSDTSDYGIRRMLEKRISSPSNRMLPVMRALSGNRPMSDMTVMDLPQPDSPIRPSVSPRSSEKLTPRTASAGPRWV